MIDLTDGASMTALSFDTRDSCISCGSKHFTTVWSASYEDASIQYYMDKYGYAVDWRSELSGQPIELAQCDQCEMLFHQHILQPASLETLYSEWIDEDQIDTLTESLEHASASTAQFEAATRNVRHILRLNRLLGKQFGNDAQPWRILDFGCGAAEFLKQASLFGFATWGVDFSTTRATQALNQQISIIPSLDSYREDNTDPVHAISLFQVLEHLDQPRETLTDLADVLAPGGILIIEVPNCGTDAEVLGAPRSFEEFRNVHPLEHINAFTPDTLTALVESIGLTKINPGPAHVTDKPDALLRSELTRFYEPKRTNQYFRKG